MPRQSSLEKYLADVAEDKTELIVRQGETRYYYRSDSVYVRTLNLGLVAETYNKTAADGGYRGKAVVGTEVEFDADGRFLGGYDLEVRIEAAGFDAEHKPTALQARIVRGTGRRGSPLYDTLAVSRNQAFRLSPIKLAVIAAQQDAEAAQRRAEQEAKVGRIKALKPDVRNAVWTTQHELERAQGSYTSNLKAVISRAEELLRRAEENPGYVYESELTNLSRIVADAVNAGGKVQAFSQVIRSELAPLFEGSPWAD